MEKATIGKHRLIALLLAEAKLILLENGGVDNWDWYSESLYPKEAETIEDIEDRLNQMVVSELEAL